MQLWLRDNCKLDDDDFFRCYQIYKLIDVVIHQQSVVWSGNLTHIFSILLYTPQNMLLYCYYFAFFLQTMCKDEERVLTFERKNIFHRQKKKEIGFGRRDNNEMNDIGDHMEVYSVTNILSLTKIIKYI